MVTQGGMDVFHQKGTAMVSDALTKILDKLELAEARQRLGMESRPRRSVDNPTAQAVRSW